MKKHLLCAAMALALLPTTSGAVTSLNRSISDSDPNKNPLWDWQSREKVRLYANDLDYRGVDVELPYYRNTGPAAEFFGTRNIDIEDEHGWRLVKRDFGSSETDVVSIPYFMLYNEVRGVLRLFLFWTRDPYTYAAVGLNMSRGNAPLFNTQASPEQAFMKDGQYDAYAGQHTLFKVNRGEWSVVDFHLSYDAEPEQGNELMFDIRGIDESNVELSGGVSLSVLLQSRVPAISQGGTKNALELIFGGAKEAVSAYSDASDNVDKLREWVDGNPGNALSQYVEDWVFSNSLDKVYTGASTAHALYEYINAGGGSAQDQMITTKGSIEGDLNISGKITLEQPEYMLKILQPGTEQTDSEAATLLNTRLGLMGMDDKPRVYYYDKRHNCQYRAEPWLHGSWKCDVTRYFKMLHSPVIRINEDITTPLEKVSKEWGWVPLSDNSLIDYRDVGEASAEPVFSRGMGKCNILFVPSSVDPYNPAQGCLYEDMTAAMLYSPQFAARVQLSLEGTEHDDNLVPVTAYRKFSTQSMAVAGQDAFEQLEKFDSARAEQALDVIANGTFAPFVTGGFTNFFAQSQYLSQGGEAMQAPTLPDGRIARIETYIDSSNGGSLYFDWKVSSQAGADKMRLLVDGEEVGSISGERDWHQFTTEITPGRHHVIWEYHKDASGRAGQDTGWVDNVGFSGVPDLHFSADRSTISYGESATLNWNSQGANICIAEGGWSGTQAVNGSFNTGPIYNQTHFLLKCANWNYPNPPKWASRVVSINVE